MTYRIDEMLKQEMESEIKLYAKLLLMGNKPTHNLQDMQAKYEKKVFETIKGKIPHYTAKRASKFLVKEFFEQQMKSIEN